MDQNQRKEDAEQQTENATHRIILGVIEILSHPCHGQATGPPEPLS